MAQLDEARRSRLDERVDKLLASLATLPAAQGEAIRGAVADLLDALRPPLDARRPPFGERFGDPAATPLEQAVIYVSNRLRR